MASRLPQGWPILAVFFLYAELYAFQKFFPAVYQQWGVQLLHHIVVACIILKNGNQILFMPWIKLMAGTLPPGPSDYPIIGGLLDFVAGPEPVMTNFKRYGPVWKTVLLGKPMAFVGGTSEKKMVLQNEGGAFEATFPPSVERMLGKNSVSFVTGVMHRTVRTILSRQINFSTLQKLLPCLEDAVIALVDKFLQQGTVATYAESKSLTFGIISQLSLSLPDGPVLRELEKQFNIWIKALFTFIEIDMPWTDYGKALKSRRRIISIIGELCMKRREELAEAGNECEPRDVLDALIMHKSEEGAPTVSFSNEAIQDLVLNLLFAGHETSSSFITWLLLCLKENPECLKAIRKEYDEIAAAKAPGEHLTWADYRNMQYTQKYINEVQRVHPTVPTVSRKTLRDVKIGGYTIPKGWQVFVSTQVGCMQAENFRDPGSFSPSHFDDTPKPFTFNPFGGGVRICPGMELARMEVSILLYHFTRKCDWEQLEKQAPISYFPIHLPGKGYVMKVSPRAL